MSKAEQFAKAVERMEFPYNTHGFPNALAAELRALAAKVAELEKVAHAGDILAHDIRPGDNREQLDRYWAMRGGFEKCTVCHPLADRESGS